MQCNYCQINKSAAINFRCIYMILLIKHLNRVIESKANSHKKMNMGRHQLLQWINQVTQSEYPTIQSLADGIAYCQIFQALHPGSINVSRMTLVTKLPIDCLRNLKILESSLKNMKITMTVSIDKMANGRFQDNILFTQWLYAHAVKVGGDGLANYRAYDRRIQILEKQGKRWDEVNVHLLPNQVYKYHENQDQSYTQGHQNQYQQQQNIQIQQRIDYIGNYISCLEVQLKQNMELNWRTMHMIGRSIDERNILYNLLQQIEKIALNCGDSPVQKQILRILYERPDDFKNNY